MLSFLLHLPLQGLFQFFQIRFFTDEGFGFDFYWLVIGSKGVLKCLNFALERVNKLL